MADGSLQHMTVREMITEAERLSRELIEHLERGFLPKVDEVSRLVRPTPKGSFDTDVEVVSVRNSVARVLESEDFTEQVCERLAKFCGAIDQGVETIVTG